MKNWTYHLRSVQTQLEEFVFHFQNSWYRLCSSLTYPLHFHLQVILWKRNRDFKCNSLILFMSIILSPMYPLHSHFQAIVWMRNNDLKFNYVDFFFEAYIFRALCILFTCTLRWSYEWETNILSVIVVFHIILKGFVYPLHLHFRAMLWMRNKDPSCKYLK